MSFNDEVKKAINPNGEDTSRSADSKQDVSFGKGIPSQFSLNIGRPVTEETEIDPNNQDKN